MGVFLPWFENPGGNVGVGTCWGSTTTLFFIIGKQLHCSGSKWSSCGSAPYRWGLITPMWVCPDWDKTGQHGILTFSESSCCPEMQVWHLGACWLPLNTEHLAELSRFFLHPGWSGDHWWWCSSFAFMQFHRKTSSDVQHDHFSNFLIISGCWNDNSLIYIWL